MTNVDMIANPPHYAAEEVTVTKKVQPISVSKCCDFMLGAAIKYLFRYKHKDGMKDLNKARQYLEWWLEDYNDQDDTGRGTLFFLPPKWVLSPFYDRKRWIRLLYQQHDTPARAVESLLKYVNQLIANNGEEK